MPDRHVQTHYLKTPLSAEDILKIKAGDTVYLTGTILTARDEAHARMIEFDEKNHPLPFDLEGAVIYHCGPVMEKKENDIWKVVAAGPTTSDRMTKMTPKVLSAHNVCALIGKGGMENIAKTLDGKCVYLSYTGGCAALAVDMIEKVETVYWDDLGMPEAVWVLSVTEFGPLIAGVDAYGNDLFRDVKEKAKKEFLEISKSV
ncbi:FumA C-terminus/TtdB family hydratase beta subunit [Methanolapillus millepedarum]|uniref:L(+)-tartrate dehydratase subunit beta n=1 Tax=Methanolapillus millepedarum TaxID=3028296 RepID=A0AA96ZVN7_9EURY|nr:L(+)-tartrate dehydratase subunit beta [Methanosarcinaceae archaeon Ac7]